VSWIEKAGIPAVGLICVGFVPTSRAVAMAEGLANARIVEFPPPNIDTQEPESVRSNAVVILDDLIKELTEIPTAGSTFSGAEFDPDEIVFTGTYDDVNEFFYENIWTDGLPIVPPTIEKVEEFMKYTDRSPDEVLGIVPPSKCEATIWSVAVNGVMAGCRPEYMPVLIAVVEAIADLGFGLQHAGSTAGWSPIIVINGPIIKQLDFNYSTGVLRPGRKANTTIGRFLRLYMVNVPRFIVGVTDQATFGNPFYMVLAEDADRNPWEDFSVDRGFASGTNLITVSSIFGAMSPQSTSSGENAENHLDAIAKLILSDFTNYSMRRDKSESMFILVCFGPMIAKIISENGYTKAQVREYLYNATMIPASDWADGADICSFVGDSLGQSLPERFCVSPNTLVPTAFSPNDYYITVSGDPYRNRSFIIYAGCEQGSHTSKEIKLPANWGTLLSEVK